MHVALLRVPVRGPAWLRLDLSADPDRGMTRQQGIPLLIFGYATESVDQVSSPPCLDRTVCQWCVPDSGAWRRSRGWSIPGTP
ncbi:hypothetical protein STAFG_3952 [Streptomyces afghaniensis 772]|uniref:Uncharacterized protein n=1 Tax=Streptomyces afghaniensis 772 TaxID=1283301 RepID=S4MYE0_9ACTN|nr:hypothetical protein STAFG_3952 [Streptomyces afghaniensis 772]